MAAAPRMLLVGALVLSGASFAFFVGARASVALDRVVTQSEARSIGSPSVAQIAVNSRAGK